MTPDAFVTDWYGWITNQSGHALIVGAMPFALLAMIIGRVWACAVVAVIYAGWEVWQVTAQGGTVGDGFADWAFVVLGAGLVWAAWERNGKASAMIWLALAASFAVGVGRRRK